MTQLVSFCLVSKGTRLVSASRKLSPNKSTEDSSTILISGCLSRIRKEDDQGDDECEENCEY
jgi:hypothetical protein